MSAPDTSPENADMSVLAANLEKYAHKCVHIDSPEKIGDLLDAAKFIRSIIHAQSTCCQGLAPSSECRCEQERLAQGHPPYQRVGICAQCAPWQPIETAPKDQRLRLWAWGKERHGRWTDDRYGRNPKPYWELEDLGITASRAHQPTHWMPCASDPALTSPKCGDGS